MATQEQLNTGLTTFPNAEKIFILTVGDEFLWHYHCYGTNPNAEQSVSYTNTQWAFDLSTGDYYHNYANLVDDVGISDPPLPARIEPMCDDEFTDNGVLNAIRTAHGTHDLSVGASPWFFYNEGTWFGNAACCDGSGTDTCCPTATNAFPSAVTTDIASTRLQLALLKTTDIEFGLNFMIVDSGIQSGNNVSGPVRMNQLFQCLVEGYTPANGCTAWKSSDLNLNSVDIPALGKYANQIKSQAVGGLTYPSGPYTENRNLADYFGGGAGMSGIGGSSFKVSWTWAGSGAAPTGSTPNAIISSGDGPGQMKNKLITALAAVGLNI